MTVYLEATVQFQINDKTHKRGNLQDAENTRMIADDKLTNCTYDANTNEFCPRFRIGDIVEKAGSNFQNITLFGGIFAIDVAWDCNFPYKYLGNTNGLFAKVFF